MYFTKNQAAEESDRQKMRTWKRLPMAVIRSALLIASRHALARSKRPPSAIKTARSSGVLVTSSRNAALRADITDAARVAILDLREGDALVFELPCFCGAVC